MIGPHEFSTAACELDSALVERFGEGDVTPAERLQVLNHLLGGCESCKRALRGRFQLLEERSDATFSMQRVLANVAELEQRLAAERRTAEEHWTDFQRHPPQRQWTLLRNSARFDTWGFAELLLEAGWAAVYDDPHAALEYNRMALAVAERLAPHDYGRSSGFDLRARAWGRVANSLRATSDLTGAEAALASAAEQLEQGSGEPLGEAEFLYFKASLRRAQRRFDEALAAVRESRSIYRMIQDPHLEGRSMLCEAMIHDLRGDVEKACEVSRLAVAQVDPRRDGRLALAARHNVVWFLMAAGRAADAMRELTELRPLYHSFGDRMNLLRLQWMEARILRLQGDLPAAEARFREAHGGFVEAEIPYEAATVALDLAVLFAESGRTHELKPLAGELVAVFHRLGVTREACAALMVFEGAARAEAVTVSLLRRLGDFLQKVRSQPDLRFDAEG